MLKCIFVRAGLVLLIIFFVSLFGVGCVTDNQLNDTEATATEDELEESIPEDETDEITEEPALGIVFETPVKSPHYVDNVPAHASIIPAVPINVIVNFDFDIIGTSEIVVTGPENKIYSHGDTLIDDNKLGMRVMMETDTPDGLYFVEYKACWPDGSCHDGSFQFAIDKSLESEYTDLRGQSEVMINMTDNRFEPQDIIIDAGTTLTWINNDQADHYINTDPHPGHNYYPDKNSSSLSNSETYSIQLNLPGYYPYHCSAHPGTMKAIIIVK